MIWFKKWTEGLNRHFSKEDIQMVKRYTKRYSTPLFFKEIQIKTTIRYHLKSVIMAIINKSTNNKCWWGCKEKGTLVHCWWECKLVQPSRKTVWNSLNKLKIELPYNPAIPFLGIYPKKSKTLIQKNISTLMFIAALFTISKYGSSPSVHQ